MSINIIALENIHSEKIMKPLTKLSFIYNLVNMVTLCGRIGRLWAATVTNLMN